MILQQDMNEMVTELVEIFFNNTLIVSIATLLIIMVVIFFVAGSQKFKRFGFMIALITWVVLVALYTIIFYLSPEIREVFNFKILSLWQDQETVMAAFTMPLAGFSVLLLLGSIILMIAIGPQKITRMWNNLRPLMKAVAFVVVFAIVGILIILITG